VCVGVWVCGCGVWWVWVRVGGGVGGGGCGVGGGGGGGGGGGVSRRFVAMEAMVAPRNSPRVRLVQRSTGTAFTPMT